MIKRTAHRAEDIAQTIAFASWLVVLKVLNR